MQQPTAPYDVGRISAQLARWQERLLDLSRANPLLGLNRSRMTRLRVTNPPASQLFAAFVAGEAVLRMPLVRKSRPRNEPGEGEGEIEEPTWTLEPGDITFDMPLPDLGRRLKRVYDNARATVEERGVTTLHLTFGVLRWSDPTLGESESPLWMVPCQLASTGLTTAMRLSRADEEMQLNPALELYLRDRHKIVLPSLPEEVTDETLTPYLDAVRRAVAEPGWRVDETVWLSTFNFEALVIYNDLEQLREAAMRHPLIAALARAGGELEASEALGEDLDALPPEITPLQVMETDSSQLEALARAVAGRHVVVHGPPGTGKSQTITALIADAIGRGKKVLFVSAKIAALEVVRRRLRELGLERFCLEAHSTKAGKAKVVDELRRTLDADELRGGDGLGDDLEALRRTRDQLNEYVRALHARQEPLGLTAYRAIGKVARLSKAPELRFALPWADPLLATRDELGAALAAIDELRAHADVFDARMAHPWRGYTGRGGDLAEREALEDALKEIRLAVAELRAALHDLTELIPSGAKLTLAELERAAGGLDAFASVERLPANWRTVVFEALKAEADVFEAAAGLAESLLREREMHDHSLTIEPAQAVELLRPLRERYRSRLSWARPSYWRWRSAVRRQLRPGAGRDRAALTTYLERAEWWVSASAELGGLRPRLEREVGSAYRDPAALLRSAKQYRAAQVLRATAVVTGALVQPTAATQDAARRLVSALPGRRAALAEALARVDAAWPGGLVEAQHSADAALDALDARCAEPLGALAKREEWIFLRRMLDHCASLGLAPFIDALGSVSARDARAAFERRFYAHWASAAIARTPALARALGTGREELIDRFKRLDQRIHLSAIRQVRAVASGPARQVRAADPRVGAASQVGILRVELQKRRRLKPLRRLFAEVPQVLQALKPCMLMSPVSVSTYLKPGSLEFDLVVFDEASQLLTPEAVPAILRAKQVVVAGDANQLPPTTFFSAQLLAADDEVDEDAYASEQLESLLDDCVVLRPQFEESWLRWHYRSRDERLIKFSNHYFYEGRLHTFPAPSTGGDGRGVRLVHVPNGVWGRGLDKRNPREARRVAQVVLEILEAYPNRSIGVVAMNVSQKEAIDDALSEELLERPDLRTLWEQKLQDAEEPAFVKPLEQVQGDERDTMVISVGYGPDHAGNVFHNYGPLNMEGGWRRLNVLVTRAKWQTILVTSLRSVQLANVNPNNRGAMALRNFIAYAEAGGELPEALSRPTDAETNDFEDAVREALRDRGLAVDTQVGAGPFRIDLAIRDRQEPGRYVLGIECDGASYHGSRTARDRDLARHEVLRRMGWRLHRVWSTDWFRDPEAALSGILRSLEQAEAAPIETFAEVEPVAAEMEPAVVENAEESAAAPPPSSTPDVAGVPYERYRHRGLRGRDFLLRPQYQHSLADNVVALVSVEGPVLLDVLIERLKEVHGVARAGDNVRGNVLGAVRRAKQSGRVEVVEDDGDVVLRSRGAQLSAFRLPNDGIQRSLEEIPREEIALAVTHVVRSQFGMLRERIPSAVANVFGFDRARAPSYDRVREVVDALVEHGQLRLSGPNIYAA